MNDLRMFKRIKELLKKLFNLNVTKPAICIAIEQISSMVCLFTYKLGCRYYILYETLILWLSLFEESCLYDVLIWVIEVVLCLGAPSIIVCVVFVS